MFMVYFKGPIDKRHRPMRLNTGELFDRLVYAPVYKDDLLPAVKSWIDLNRKRAPASRPTKTPTAARGSADPPPPS